MGNLSMESLTWNEAEQAMNQCAFEHARAVVIGRSDPQVVFMVRERSAMIRYLGEARLSLRGRLFLPEDCVLVLILLKVGRYLPRIYALWWDYHLPRQVECFSLMQRQEMLVAHFYGDNALRERSFLAENVFQDLFAQAVSRAASKPPWSADCFEQHRQRIIKNSGSLESLWAACSKDAETD